MRQANKTVHSQDCDLVIAREGQNRACLRITTTVNASRECASSTHNPIHPPPTLHISPSFAPAKRIFALLELHS